MRKSAMVALALIATPAASQPWITDVDYPASFARQHLEGTVQVELTFDGQGRVIQCLILRSSGTAILDATTCRILRHRARAAAGDPRVRTYEHHWRVPTQQ